MKPRIAHFLLNRELAHSPPNDALVSAWLAMDCEVDLYAPGGKFDVSRYGPGVRAFSCEYGWRWLARNAWRAHWRQYALFSGTTEDPMGVAGTLGRLHGRPIVTLADEIKSGSYAGDRSLRWRRLCAAGMARSALTIVNTPERVVLQRALCGLSPARPVMVYPGCFRVCPPAGDRLALRRARAIPDDALVISYSGGISEGAGAVWMAQLLRQVTDLWMWATVVNWHPLMRGWAECLQGSERLAIEPNRLGWHEAWSSIVAADIGLCIYLQDAPQWDPLESTCRHASLSIL